MEIYLVFVDTIQNSNKFWSAKIEGSNLTVEWGRVGYKSQTKVHSFSDRSAAVKKFYSLIADKKAKGYRESQPQMDSSCNISEIERAIQLLNALRSYVVNRNFDEHYILILNQYLKIVPTPLGMQIDPYRVYRTVADVDYQKELLNSLLTTSTPQPAVVAVAHTPESTVEKVVSLKTISKSFWRHL
ncbi:WGR domain-containing protein [Komarekiella sp. 'clone 1']|uniref:WGR domain-containing protein n=1 Tax=Komarekiella delphini-convector SJRDD-AB1 TaxID=2593771 RepID=A0AA40VUC4_9NOST|nr:WGR domain-containing protein [Komarekiella delphini-convector]MBD6620037.1 WGR domain-containing protein [Komarekiella delphini-convector SJRDD-AB1]